MIFRDLLTTSIWINKFQATYKEKALRVEIMMVRIPGMLGLYLFLYIFAGKAYSNMFTIRWQLLISHNPLQLTLRITKTQLHTELMVFH